VKRGYLITFVAVVIILAVGIIVYSQAEPPRVLAKTVYGTRSAGGNEARLEIIGENPINGYLEAKVFVNETAI